MTRKFVVALWLLLPVINWAKDFFKGRFNNYKIFKGVFWHLTNRQNLYAEYPSEYGDTNHYGPTFSLMIAPFAVLPDIAGMLFWGLFNVIVLFLALKRMKLTEKYETMLMLLCMVELANSVWHQQFNPSITAMMLLSYVMVEEEQDFLAPSMIMLGFLIKLYTIVGLAFFLFSKNKIKFIAGCVFWFVVLFALPMVFSSPEFVLQSYLDWKVSLTDKSAQSASLDSAQDISVMGFVKRLFVLPGLPNWPFWFVGLAAVLVPLTRFSQHKSRLFRLYTLCSLLLFIVLFSPGSENPTYIICVTGVFLWMLLQREIFSTRNIIITVLVIVVCGLMPTDLLSVSARKFSTAYALKVIPCVIVWGILVWQQITMNFLDPKHEEVLQRFKPDPLK